jgi:hypothetical protein
MSDVAVHGALIRIPAGHEAEHLAHTRFDVALQGLLR